MTEQDAIVLADAINRAWMARYAGPEVFEVPALCNRVRALGEDRDCWLANAKAIEKALQRRTGWAVSGGEAVNVRRWSLHRFSAEGVELLPRLAIGHDAAGKFWAAMTWVKWSWLHWNYQFTWHHAPGIVRPGDILVAEARRLQRGVER